MNEFPPEHHEAPSDVSHDITPYDSLAIFLEERERTEAEVMAAVEVAVRSVFLLSEEEWEDAVGEIVGIALEHGIEPDAVLELYALLSPESE